MKLINRLSVILTITNNLAFIRPLHEETCSYRHIRTNLSMVYFSELPGCVCVFFSFFFSMSKWLRAACPLPISSKNGESVIIKAYVAYTVGFFKKGVTRIRSIKERYFLFYINHNMCLGIPGSAHFNDLLTTHT